MIILSLAVVCALLAGVPAAIASPQTGKACTVSGCHMIDANYSIDVTTTATTRDTVTYGLTLTGTSQMAWAAFSGPTLLAHGEGIEGSFVALRGLDYDVFLIGRRGFATGGVSKHITASPVSLPSTATPDSTPPVVSTDARPSYGGTARITVSAADVAPGWGVAYIYYSLDGGGPVMHRAPGLAESSVSFTVPASPAGAHTLEYWAQDRAGNVSAVKSAEFVAKARTRVSLTTPVAPSVMTRNRSYRVHGYLKPRHAAGTSPVRVYRQRLVSGKWVDEGFAAAVASDYSSHTRYSAAVRLPAAGRWRLRAYAPASEQHLATWSSGYDYVTVR